MEVRTDAVDSVVLLAEAGHVVLLVPEDQGGIGRVDATTHAALPGRDLRRYGLKRSPLDAVLAAFEAKLG